MSRNLQWILCAVQDFDISVSRAMELIEFDRSGKFTDDMMPVDVRSGRLFSLDDAPIQKYEELLAERDDLTIKLSWLEGQEPVGEVTHSSIYRNANGKYHHQFLSDMRIDVRAGLYARPVPPVDPANKDETIDNLWGQSAHGTRREDIAAAYNAGALAEQERHGPVASMELDDDHPLSLVDSQINGLLQGQGASEDHEDVIAFFLKTGLPRSTVNRIHQAIVWGDMKTDLRADIFRSMINELRDTAKNFHDHDSLRERLRGVVNKFIKVQL